MSSTCLDWVAPRILAWDSAYFNQRVATFEQERPNSCDIERALRWGDDNRVDCMYASIPISHTESMAKLVRNGFDPMDLRIDFEGKPSDVKLLAKSAVLVRSWKPADIPVLKAIARDSHKDGRFLSDKRFSIESRDLFYPTWIENSCNGYADRVLVAEYSGQVVGYVTGHIHKGLGRIGLIAASPNFQGKGIGCALMVDAIAWFRDEGCQQVKVATSGSNLVAQRFYQKSGFASCELRMQLHCWYQRSAE